MTNLTSTVITSKYLAPPIIWETGNRFQISSLLSFREAELTLVKAQLTGYAYGDWSIRNQIRDLEIKITDLKRLLAEASKDNGNGN